MAQGIQLKLTDSDNVIVEGEAQAASRLLGRSIREGSRITFIEAAYLVYIGAARIISINGEELSFRDLMRRALSKNPYAWVEFEVYYDLRKRGKLPVPGPRQHSLLLRRSKKDPRYTHYILILEESRRIEIETLLSFVEEALHNQWEPLVAIVDRYGDITYYSVRSIYPRRKATSLDAETGGLPPVSRSISPSY